MASTCCCAAVCSLGNLPWVEPALKQAKQLETETEAREWKRFRRSNINRLAEYLQPQLEGKGARTFSIRVAS